MKISNVLNKKVLILTTVLGLFASISSTLDVEAASREEIAKISSSPKTCFRYWNKDSVAKQKLVAYVKDITDKSSKNYIPVEERIATFDMDGTLIGETTPFYFEWMVYLDRVYNDPNYYASKEIKQRAAIVKEAIAKHAVTDEIDVMETKDKMTVLAGLNEQELGKVIQHTMDLPVPGMTNMKYGEMIFLPMAEVISYLNQNNFTVYIVSGGYRQIIRHYVKGALAVAPNHIIGADTVLKATNQHFTSDLKYQFDREKDEIITTAVNLESNVAVCKAQKIYREIGMKPVLSFGNSMGDASMHEYTLSNNKYKTMVFELLCDDVDREYGNLKKAEKTRKACEKYGWIPVSMRNDWKTIYGDNVKKK